MPTCFKNGPRRGALRSNSIPPASEIRAAWCSSCRFASSALQQRLPDGKHHLSQGQYYWQLTHVHFYHTETAKTTALHSPSHNANLVYLSLRPLENDRRSLGNDRHPTGQRNVQAVGQQECLYPTSQQLMKSQRWLHQYRMELSMTSLRSSRSPGS